MGETNETPKQELPSSIPNAHLNGEISTGLDDLNNVKALLGHSGQFNNEPLMLKIKDYLMANNQKIQGEDRKDIASYLAQVVVFNQRKNPELAEKMREVLLAFTS